MGFAAPVLMVKMALTAGGARLAAAPVPDADRLRQEGQQLLFYSAADRLAVAHGLVDLQSARSDEPQPSPPALPSSIGVGLSTYE